MRVLYAKNYAEHDPQFEYYDGVQTPYAEQPARITQLLEGCRRLGLTPEEIDDTTSSEAAIENLHGKLYVNYLKNRSQAIPEGDELIPSVFISDTYSPLTRHTYDVAAGSAQLALIGAEYIAQDGSDQLYALCRPPGHHAEHSSMQGYCYFNNAALAATALAERGRVAILDIDYHHGNGTQSFFYDRGDVLYVSLHADPIIAYPYKSGFTDETGEGDGQGYTRNFPLPKDTTPELYLSTLMKACTAINDYAPDYLVVSLGFDTYKNDPIAGLGLDEADYQRVGKTIRDNLPYPTLIIQEGGYNVEKLAALSENFLRGVRHS